MNWWSRARRMLTYVLVLAAAYVVVAPMAATAATDAPAMSFSSDGRTFAETLERPIFENVGALVPQGSEERSLWIRNDTPDDANLRVTVRNVEASSIELESSLVFTTIDGPTRISHGVDELERCDVVLPSRSISAGQTIRVDLVVALRDVAGSTAQEGQLSFDLTTTMRDAAAGAFPEDACDDGIGIPVFGGDASAANGALAITGTSAPTAALVLAGALLAVGTLIVAGRRRRRERKS